MKYTNAEIERIRKQGFKLLDQGKCKQGNALLDKALDMEKEGERTKNQLLRQMEMGVVC